MDQPPPDINPVFLVWLLIAVISFIVLLALVIPEDADVDHDDKGDGPPPQFPMF